jgi:hypothetical protein
MTIKHDSQSFEPNVPLVESMISLRILSPCGIPPRFQMRDESNDTRITSNLRIRDIEDILGKDRDIRAIVSMMKEDGSFGQNPKPRPLDGVETNPNLERCSR